jgi:O-antigen/teichoic acid export membrane protein
MSKNSLLRNGFWATYGAITTRFLTLLSNLLLARLLMPKEFGVIGVAYIFWALVNLFNQDTVGSFIIYKGIEDKRYVNTTFTISLGLGLILAVILVAVSPLAANFFQVPSLIWILMVFAFNLVVSFVQSIYGGILTRRMQYREIANSNLIASLIRVFTTVCCALSGLSYWSFVIGDTVYWLTVTALMRHHAKINFSLQIDPQARSEVLRYCLSAITFGLGYYVNANGDNFVIGRILGTTNLGYYNFAYQLTMALTSILGQAIGQVSMSAFAQMTDDKEQENALVKVVEQIAFLAAPIYALFFLVMDKQTISFIFGSKWIPATIVIPWLLIFSYFRLINGSLSCMLAAKGRPDINAKVNMLIAPLAACGFVIGAKTGGIFGVSITVALVLGIIWTVYWWWYACRVLKWSVLKFLIPCFKPAAISIIGTLISLNVTLIFLKPIVFIPIYIVAVRLMARSQFIDCLTLVRKVVNRVRFKIARKSTP